MVLALAGRRIDEDNAGYCRFPLNKVIEVRKWLENYYRVHNVASIVCSAACGADLIALDIAGRMGIERWVILPTMPSIFKINSVSDRPGDWGDLYDTIINQLVIEERLVILHLDPDDDATYTITNTEIIHQSMVLASGIKSGHSLKALVLWEGQARSEKDITFDFIEKAKQNNIVVDEIRTDKFD